MSDGPREIGNVVGVSGYPVIVSVDRDAVTVWAPRPIILDAGRREHFQKLFMQAEREAEAWAESYGERPRTETDCRCPVGDECPCEADGLDGLCRCCRSPDGEHRGTCAAPGMTAGEVPSGG